MTLELTESCSTDSTSLLSSSRKSRANLGFSRMMPTNRVRAAGTLLFRTLALCYCNPKGIGDATMMQGGDASSNGGMGANPTCEVLQSTFISLHQKSQCRYLFLSPFIISCIMLFTLVTHAALLSAFSKLDPVSAQSSSTNSTLASLGSSNCWCRCPRLFPTPASSGFPSAYPSASTLSYPNVTSNGNKTSWNYTSSLSRSLSHPSQTPVSLIPAVHPDVDTTEMRNLAPRHGQEMYYASGESSFTSLLLFLPDSHVQILRPPTPSPTSPPTHHSPLCNSPTRPTYPPSIPHHEVSTSNLLAPLRSPTRRQHGRGRIRSCW